MMQLGVDGVFVGSGHLQVRGPGDDGARDRRGDHALPGPRRLGEGRRAASATRWPGWRSARSRRACKTAAGSPMKAGVLALQGDFREHARVFAGRGRDTDRGPHRRAARAGRLSGDPRRRVDDDREARPRLRPRRAAARARRRGHADPRHLRGHDRARDRGARRRAAVRADGHHRAPQRLRSAGRLLRGRHRRARRRARRSAASSSAPRGSSGSAPASRCSRRSRTGPSSSSRGTWLWHPSTRSSWARPGSTSTC